MPYINHVLHTPVEAIDKGYCPECGRDLALSSYQVETMLHWPRGFDPTEASPEAIARGKMLADYFNDPKRPVALSVEERLARLEAKHGLDAESTFASAEVK